MKSRIYLLLLIFLCVSPALADTLLPGEVLQVTFTLPSAPTCGAGCDTLLLLLNGDNVSGPVINSAELFNGSSLLGAYQGAGVPAFESAGSLYGSNGVVNFASIVNGSIQGIIDFSITGGTLTYSTNLSQDVIFVGHASGPGAAQGQEYSVQSLAILTPEPASLALLLTGMVMLPAFCGLRRRKAIATSTRA